VDCQHIEQEEMIERYLAGKLAQAEAEAFEQHYLGCQRCFDELRFHHATAIELKTKRVVSSRKTAVAWTGWRTWAAAAAVILVGVLASVPIFYRRQNFEIVQQPAGQQDNRQEVIARLAQVEAPAYASSTLRGGAGSAALGRFQEGMKRYQQRDYAGASTQRKVIGY
jgi:hypothetical protein